MLWFRYRRACDGRYDNFHTSMQHTIRIQRVRDDPCKVSAFPSHRSDFFPMTNAFGWKRMRWNHSFARTDWTNCVKKNLVNNVRLICCNTQHGTILATIEFAFENARGPIISHLINDFHTSNWSQLSPGHQESAEERVVCFSKYAQAGMRDFKRWQSLSKENMRTRTL